MTTFKNNAKYAELLLMYLDVAYREDTPLTVPDVLRAFSWRFKGGSLSKTSQETRLQPETSSDVYPDGLSEVIAGQWPGGEQAQALRALLSHRMRSGKLRNRGVLARIATYQVLTSSYGEAVGPVTVYSGMRAVYRLFDLVWGWALRARPDRNWELLCDYTQELLAGSSVVSRVHVPTAEANRREYWDMLSISRAPALMTAVLQAKDLIRVANGAQARWLARQMGNEERERWGPDVGPMMKERRILTDQKGLTRSLRVEVGPLLLKVSQGCALLGTGGVRYAMGKTDMERFHQLLMSATSALVGVCAQACVGTATQKLKARQAVGVAEANIDRIVRSSRLVPLGDEVLVCKGYRRAYTAHLGWLAGALCKEETRVLEQEAVATAPDGVLDVEGFLYDVRSLDAASSLNAAKMFKICPTPDVSPGSAMMDRVHQIGNGNVMDPSLRGPFRDELRTQILRAYVRSRTGRLRLRNETNRPPWFGDYLQGKFDEVPSAEIHQYLNWEATAKMPDVSPYDPAHWKDSGLGADTEWEAMRKYSLGVKSNMITRLIFDEECPMPGREGLSTEHVIKFFVKSEGHKDPARGIFSANLTDRQAQSWMERGVEAVAKAHPSYMIGQGVDVREARVVQLTARPTRDGWVALYYSFDISGWSAKMPAEPQRISHELWGDLYGGHLYRRAHEINEGAYIYLNMDGYMGWYRNTHSNLEGFNGKEMTMVLIALLSLSVRRWRTKVVDLGVLTEQVAASTSALLFAYIDDGLSRIDLPASRAVAAFSVYKETVIETFRLCGFTVEVSKCFPSDRFSIFLNEVYLAGRHVVHGVRAAMGISAEPTERHTSLVERVTSVSTGCRGAVMAGLNPMSATLLLAYHTLLHLLEWVSERDPVVLSVWSLCPRAWGGLGLPNVLQLFVSGSGSAFEEGVSTLQAYSKINVTAKKLFVKMSKGRLKERDHVGVLVAPLSGRVEGGYMVDTRVAVAVRKALQEAMEDGRLSTYAMRLLKYADMGNFRDYAEAVVPLDCKEVLQEQMLINVSEAHPHSIFAAFARRLEKSMTVLTVVGRELFTDILRQNRLEASMSVEKVRERIMW